MEARTIKELQKKIFDLTLALYRVTDFFPNGEALRKHLREKASDIFGRVSEYGIAEGNEDEVLAILAKLESARGYLNISRALRFVKPINLSILEGEYKKAGDFFLEELVALKKKTEEKRNAIASHSAKAEDAEDESLKTWSEFAAKKESKQTEDKEAKPVVEALKTQDVSKAKPNNGNITTGDVNERQKKIIEYIGKVPQAKISDFFAVFSDISSKTIQRDLQDLVARNILKKEGEKRWTIYTRT